MIKKNEWITKLELESISKKVLQKEKDIEKTTIMTILVNGFIRMKRTCTRMKPLRLIQRI